MANKKKKSKNWIIIVLVVLVAALIAAAVFGKKGKKKGIAIEVGEVKKRTLIEKVAATGKIFPELEIKFTSVV